jgi:[ribosomal protein S5]-alanine N-acetyltransferase
MTTTSYPSYETERLILQLTVEADAPFLLELLNTPKWLQYIGDRNVRSVEDAVNYIQQKITPQFQRLGFASYTVIRKSDGVRVGTCGLFDREGLDGVDIGFAFLPQYEGQGYAFESAQKILEAGIHDFKLSKISAITTRDNIASQKLIEKLGLRFSKMVTIPNDDEELMLYVLKVG